MKHEVTYKELKKIGFYYEDENGKEDSDDKEFEIIIDREEKQITVSVLTDFGSYEPIDVFYAGEYEGLLKDVQKAIKSHQLSFVLKEV